ncbi:hypothetical protein Tco_1563106 [Tanacetum coccineum]
MQISLDQCESDNALTVSAAVQASVINVQMVSAANNTSELGIQDHSNEQSSSKLVPKVVFSLAVNTATSRQSSGEITIPPSHSNAEDNSSRTRIVYASVRLPLALEEKSSNIWFFNVQYAPSLQSTKTKMPNRSRAKRSSNSR